MTRRGFFVVLEGPEGSGKSSLIEPLAARMRESGLDPIVIREPGSTQGRRDRPRGVAGSRTPRGTTGGALSLPRRPGGSRTAGHSAGARGGQDCPLRPLRDDHGGLPDGRSGHPSRGGAPGQSSRGGGLRPDLTLIIDIPVEVGRARQEAAGKRLDRIERESPDFHTRVNEYYLAVRGDGVRHLDGLLSPDRLLQAAWDEVARAASETLGVTTD